MGMATLCQNQASESEWRGEPLTPIKQRTPQRGPAGLLPLSSPAGSSSCRGSSDVSQNKETHLLSADSLCTMEPNHLQGSSSHGQSRHKLLPQPDQPPTPTRLTHANDHRLRPRHQPQDSTQGIRGGAGSPGTGSGLPIDPRGQASRGPRASPARSEHQLRQAAIGLGRIHPAGHSR